MLIRCGQAATLQIRTSRWPFLLPLRCCCVLVLGKSATTCGAPAQSPLQPLQHHDCCKRAYASKAQASGGGLSTDGHPSADTRAAAATAAAAAIAITAAAIAITAAAIAAATKVRPPQAAAADPMFMPDGSPATTDRTVVLQHIDSLSDLAAAIDKFRPHGDKPGVTHTVLQCDLGGRVLQGGGLTSHLVIPPGLRLQISNGSLILPDFLAMRVRPRAALEAANISIEGRALRNAGVVNVMGRAVLQQCTITNRPAPLLLSEEHGVVVDNGGTATLNSCLLATAVKCGVLVRRKGSTACATSCTARNCFYGFSAQHGGKLRVERSTAFQNLTGFYVEKGAQLDVGPECRAECNKGCGFEADGAQLIVGERCYAGYNGSVGFLVSGPKAYLSAGAGCVAEHNRIGFDAWHRGQLHAGPACVAQHNRDSGFRASLYGEITAGEGSCASCNGWLDFDICCVG